MQENLQEMIKIHNSTDSLTPEPAINLNSMLNEVDNSSVQESSLSVETVETSSTIVKENKDVVKIPLTNFYDWYEKHSKSILNLCRVTTNVSNVNSKDSIIFKVQKVGKSEEMELVSFYNPSLRPILDLPPVWLKIFKNDTFESLHQYNEEIYIKSYGVKAGLIIVFCAVVDGKLIPYEKNKVKKNSDTVDLVGNTGISNLIKEKMKLPLDFEAVQLLYTQAIKSKDELTSKQNLVEWFDKKEKEILDINHLLKIDNVLILTI